MPITFATAGTRLTASKASVLSGTLRPLKTMKVMVAGALRQVATFAGPMTVSAVPDTAYGYGSSRKPQRVETNAVTATPAGGFAPYRYAWTVDDPSVSIIAPTMATTRFTGFDAYTIARCTVTDAVGTTASVEVPVTIQSELV